MAPTCFGLQPLSGSLQLSLAKVILILKHSVRLHRYLLCGGVAAFPGKVCVLCAVLTLYRDMLPHHRITNNDVTLLNVFISI
jgi:hypothetical protein